MQIITIHIGEAPDGRPSLQLFYSDGIDPAQGASACRSAVRMFDDLTIEREVARRLQEAAEQPEIEVG